MRIVVILNPAAGSGGEIAEAITTFTAVRDVPVWPTSEVGDGRTLARRAAEEGFDRVIAVGGDGTINEVANGLTESRADVELAVVPLGTGNDFARSLGIPIGDVKAALTIAGDRPAVAIDVASVSYHGGTTFFLNAACGGLGGEIARAVTSEQKQRWGALAYWSAAFGRLGDMPEHDVTLNLDGYETKFQLCGLAAANGRFIAGGMLIAPQALLNDGKLDLVVLPVQPVGRIIGAGLDTMMGRSQEGGRLWHFRASRIAVKSAPPLLLDVDGETKGRDDALIEVHAGALRAVASEEAPGLERDVQGEAAFEEFASEERGA